MKASVTCKLFPWTIDLNKTGGHDKSLKAAHRNLLVDRKLKIYQANKKNRKVFQNFDCQNKHQLPRYLSKPLHLRK